MLKDFWRIDTIADKTKSVSFFAFGRAYEFSKSIDLRHTASKLSEGIVACSPSFIAGSIHLELLLAQSAECWGRDLFLARNRSIDLLLRLTCENQISKAIQASAIESCRKVAIVGLAKEASEIATSEKLIAGLGGQRNDLLLALDSKKEQFLRRTHELPSSVKKNKIPEFLQESSAMLVFPS